MGLWSVVYDILSATKWEPPALLLYSLLWLLNKLLDLFAAYDLDNKSGDCIWSRRVFLSHDAGDVIGIPWRKRRRAREASITADRGLHSSNRYHSVRNIFSSIFHIQSKAQHKKTITDLLTIIPFPFSSLFFQDQVDLVSHTVCLKNCFLRGRASCLLFLHHGYLFVPSLELQRPTPCSTLQRSHFSTQTLVIYECVFCIF